MIKVTNAAKKYFLKLLSTQEKNTQIRIFVINKDTLKAECGISYCNINSVKSNDIEFKFGNFSIYIKKNILHYLKNAEIDLLVKNLNEQLTIKAPNIKKIYSKKNKKPLSERIKQVLDTKINPKLSWHGGYISLIEVTSNKYAVLQFHGGCNGCAMANVTFKNFIEKELITYFPELKGISDITQHEHNKESYF